MSSHNGAVEGHAGQRTLAAIVFTDVAGFSVVAGLDEQRAVEMLHRDLDVMRASCAKHEGKVLNVMGDGLLMMFGSAVEAMECTLEIQRAFHEFAKDAKKEDVLHHRIGVHLGDVILDGDNVLGDGVNVASRLQAEARPDSICFSRTVYDVIKNKVHVPAVYLGPRTLKNIPERVMVWQVPPVGDAAAALADRGFADLATPEPGFGGMKGAMVIAGSLFLIVCCVLAVFAVQALEHRRTPKPAVVTPVTAPRTDAPVVPKVTDSPPAAPGPDLDALRRAYDFDGLVNALKGAGADQQQGGPAEIEKYQTLAAMRNWVDQQLGAVPQDNPLRAMVDVGVGEVPCTVYGGPTGTVVDTGGSPRSLSLWSLPPGSVLNVATALSQYGQAPSMAPAWLQTFAREYGLRGQ